MTKHGGGATFLLGLLAVLWVGVGYVGSNPLALLVTALIAACYLMGALELRRFHTTTTTLEAALAHIPAPLAQLADWLPAVPAPLQNAVRQRIEGDRVGLPGPAMTPYLVGLLVLLGMLGTFLGMVVTLKGAVMALETTTDLATMRAALTAPVKGLGLAFGTSVAGVAASAMLGLLSALCRRARLQAAQLLDSRIAGPLREFSLAHQRDQTLHTLRSLEAQGRALPALAGQWQAMAAQMATDMAAQTSAQTSAHMAATLAAQTAHTAQMAQQHQALNAQLLANQDNFQRNTTVAFADLAASVDRALQASLSEGARLAGATLQPVVEATRATLAGIRHDSSALHERLATSAQQQLTAAQQQLSSAQQQLGALVAHTGSSITTLADGWQEALARQQHSSAQQAAGLQATLAASAEAFAQQSATLVASVGQAHGALRADLASQEQQRQSAQAEGLARLTAQWQQDWQQAWQQAGAQSLAQQQQICQTLEATAQRIHTQAERQAHSTLAELAGVVATAAQAPQAAAEVMALMRERLSDSLARDNALLAERQQLLAGLAKLLDTVREASSGQRSAVDALVAASAATLHEVGAQFSQQVQAQADKLGSAATHVAAGAVEVASLGDAFGQAVAQFGASSQALGEQLQRIEAALGKSTARSDEQLAYYVAQAREIIDLSLLSQKQIVDDLHALARQAQTPAHAQRQPVAAGELA